jgi:hypothetical protein
VRRWCHRLRFQAGRDAVDRHGAKRDSALVAGVCRPAATQLESKRDNAAGRCSLHEPAYVRTDRRGRMSPERGGGGGGVCPPPPGGGVPAPE